MSARLEPQRSRKMGESTTLGTDGFAEVLGRFVNADQTEPDGFAIADQGLHLGEEGVFELHVCIALVAELQHQVVNLPEGALWERSVFPSNSRSIREGMRDASIEGLKSVESDTKCSLSSSCCLS